MAGIVLPNVPPILSTPAVFPGLSVQGLSINKLLTCIDMLKDMFRVSGRKIDNSAIANLILKSFGVNYQQPAAAEIDKLTVNMSLWESTYKKKLTDSIELYAKNMGIFTTHRFFYKKNVALTTESRLPYICRFVVDVGYDPRVINPGAISLVGHGSTIDNGPRAHFKQGIDDGSLQLFPQPNQVLDMSSIYSGMDHICVTDCNYTVNETGIARTIINAVISGQNVVINILRNVFLPVADNFVSATYLVYGQALVNWVPASNGDICSPNDDKNNRANAHVNSGLGLQIEDFIRILLKFLGDEALCILTFIADHYFLNTTREGRVAIMTGDGMVRLRCLLMGIPFVKQFDGSAQTLEAAPTDREKNIKTCEFEHWCPHSDPKLIYGLFVERVYSTVKSHNDGIKQLLLSSIAVKQIGITATMVYPFGNSKLKCYLDILIQKIDFIQQLSKMFFHILHPDANPEETQKVLANLMIELPRLCAEVGIDPNVVLPLFTENGNFSMDTNKNARGSEIEAFFKVFKVNSFIERKNKQIVALKVSNLLESSNYIRPAIALTPTHKKPFVDYVYGLIKGTITYQSQGGGGNKQRGGVVFCRTEPLDTTIDTYIPLYMILKLRTGLLDDEGGLTPVAKQMIVTRAASGAKDETSSIVSINVPSEDNKKLTDTYDYHESRVDEPFTGQDRQFTLGKHFRGSKQELENICLRSHVSLFEVGHFWLRNLIEMYINSHISQVENIGLYTSNPLLQIDSEDVLTICKGNLEQARILLVTFLSCYYYEYLEKARPISERKGSQCLLDDLYWEGPIEHAGEDEQVHDVISLNGLTLEQHIDSWLIVLGRTHEIPQYEVINVGGKTFFKLDDKDRNVHILNDEGKDIRSSSFKIENGPTIFAVRPTGLLGFLDESFKFIGPITIEDKIYYRIGQTLYDASFKQFATVTTINNKTYYRIGQDLYDESIKSKYQIVPFGATGTETVKIGQITHRLRGGSKRKVKSNKRSNKRSNMNRKTRKNRFSLLGKRTPSARMPKTRTKTQSAKPKQRKNRTLRIKQK